MSTSLETHIPPRDSTCLLRLVLMRHGDPEEAAQGRCCGSFDIGLSQAGRRRIADKIHTLRSLEPKALYTSTARRAIESASEVAKELKLQAHAVPELCEINFGIFEGLTYGEIESRYPRYFKKWMAQPTDMKFPGGESLKQMKDRVLRFLKSLFPAHPGKAVLIISHAGVNRVILAEALGLARKSLFRIDQCYGAFNVVDYFSEFAVVRMMNA